MICYRDMTFCTFWEECSRSEECHRPLTKEVREAAEKWWGGPDYPICCFVEVPDCFEEKELDNEEKM